MTSGSVYFNTKRYNEKHQIQSRRVNEQAVSFLEPDIANEKRDPRDFALWKGRDRSTDELKFQAPWGYGRPGWHIECSAMTRLDKRKVHRLCI